MTHVHMGSGINFYTFQDCRRGLLSYFLELGFSQFPGGGDEGVEFRISRWFQGFKIPRLQGWETLFKDTCSMFKETRGRGFHIFEGLGKGEGNFLISEGKNWVAGSFLVSVGGVLV